MNRSVNIIKEGASLQDVAQAYAGNTGTSLINGSNRIRSAVDKWILPAIGTVPINEVTSDHRRVVVTEFMREAVHDGAANILEELRVVLKCLLAILVFGVEQGILGQLPYPMALIQMDPGNAPLMPVSAVPAFLQAVDALTRRRQVRLAVRMFLFLGLRVSELARMRWDWFKQDMSGVTILEPHRWKRRYLPVPGFLAGDLAEFHDDVERQCAINCKDTPPWVFFNAKNLPHCPSQVRASIQLAALVNGYDGVWTPQTLRFSCVSILCELGASAAHIRSFFGMGISAWEPEFLPGYPSGISDIQDKIALLPGTGYRCNFE